MRPDPQQRDADDPSGERDVREAEWRHEGKGADQAEGKPAVSGRKGHDGKRHKGAE